MYCTVCVLCHMTVMVQLLEKEIVSWAFEGLRQMYNVEKH